MEDFHTKIDKEKREHIGNLARGDKPEFDPEAIRQFFADKKVDPETIANFFEVNKKGKDYLEGMFPQLRLDDNGAQKIMKEIHDVIPEGFSSPDDLLAAIAGYVRSKMSYDLLTVLFEKPGEEEYTAMIRQTLNNPRAKFAMSEQEIDELQRFAMNVKMNGRLSVSEGKILDDIAVHAYDKDWLREQALNNAPFRMLLKKLQYSKHLYVSKEGGLLRTNENASRDVYEILNNVQVGVCRDFTMIIKKIYEQMSKDIFPHSKAIYVANIAEGHAYILLAYDKKNGEIEKNYYDPTSYITGWALRVPKNGTYGNKKNEIWAANKDPDATAMA